MLIFLIPFKNKETANSWAIASKLLNRTLRSILNQKCKDFKAIVICNQMPESSIIDTNIFYLKMDNPSYAHSHHLKQIDKSAKLLAGFKFAQQFKPNYIMAVDADDFINQEIAGYIKHNPANGYYINKGYVYTSKSDLYVQQKDFNRICGTALITKADLFKSCFTNSFYCQFQSKSINGNSIYPLPFYGAIYNRGHGENMDEDVPFDQDKIIPISTEIIKTFNFKVQ